MAKIPHAARLSELPERVQYAAVELFRGTITQHNFIAYRSDRTTERQPIRFTGERWRNYVPIRLPWTVCIRDRVPAGIAAVLINRAHKHTDLVLKIDAAQYRMLEEIDGQRSLAEIAERSGSDDLHIIEYFSSSGQYDQIVFDASHAVATTNGVSGGSEACGLSTSG